MKLRTGFGRRRNGFTLIELLMVIAIIGVLISLLMAAVMKITGKGEEVSARTDISQLSQGLQAFMAKYGLKDPPPSRLFLGHTQAQFGNLAQPGIQKDSYEYLTRVWPRLAITNAGSGFVNWSSRPGATFNSPPPPMLLEGHQCLVFFLGGIPSALGCEGFSTSPIDPSLLTGDRVRFFDFKTTRLVTPNNLPWSPGVFYAYKDAFEKAPYAYFSAYKTSNGYNRYFISGTEPSDCQSLGVWPYAVFLGTPRKYLNSDTFQIISAGQDGVFGPGTDLKTGISIWVPKQPMYQPPKSNESGNGYDDMANFHDKLLGIPD